MPNETVRAPTLDVLIGDVIGNDTRFKSIEMSASGIERSYSYRGAGAANPSEVSPLALYRRIFGEGFQDPNAAEFVPETSTMVRQSVLSGYFRRTPGLMRTVGASDRDRLDEYFTGIRQLEQQLEIQLQPPAPVENFTMPEAPPETTVDSDIENVMVNHKLMAGLLAKALASNQTKVFNMLFSDTTSNLRSSNSSDTHHTLTHEEPVDPELGYQRQVGFFAERA